MSKTPLNEPEWDHFDRALLASAELDSPESGALARARHALAAATLGSAVLVSASTSLGASSSVAGASLVGVPLALLSKALLVGAVVGVGFVGAVNGGFSAPPESRPALSGAPRAPTSHVNAAPGLPAVQPALAATEPAKEAPAESVLAPPERNSPIAKLPPTPARVTSLAVEVELLDRARAALVRKEPRAALAELDRYAQLSIERSLGREASLLRIEALRDLGRAATAAELARKLADEDPHGLTGQRARELVR